MRYSRLLVFILIMMGTCVFAHDWVYSPNGDKDIYIDTDNIIKNDKGIFYIVKYRDDNLNKNLYTLVMSTSENSAGVVKSYTEEDYKKIKNWKSVISNSNVKSIKLLTYESPLYNANSLARVIANESSKPSDGAKAPLVGPVSKVGNSQGANVAKEPDFGPYMRELQRRIKMNWDPPKGDESKRVVLLFKIAKDGRLLSCSVFKSSGLQEADAAALNAVKITAPFKPLPSEFSGSSIDIQFTFDYNVIGATQY